MASKLRLSTQTLQVLDALLTAPRQWRYGYELSQQTGLKSGTLYPILMRLSEHSLMKTRWEQGVEGRPARHMYMLTAEGARVARELRSSPAARALRPALGES